MRKIGTVTKYYPFIDSEIRKTLDSILDDAHNYNDFINRLSHELSKVNAPEILAHIGAVLSSNIENIEANRRISD